MAIDRRDLIGLLVQNLYLRKFLTLPVPADLLYTVKSDRFLNC